VPALPTRSPMARERSEIDTFTIPEGRRRRVYRPGHNVGARQCVVNSKCYGARVRSPGERSDTRGPWQDEIPHIAALMRATVNSLRTDLLFAQAQSQEATCDKSTCRANHLKPVQPLAQKYSAFHPTQISGYFHAVPTRQEGRIARRHERGTGCGGRSSSGAMRVRRAVSAVSERRAQDDRRCSVRQNRVVLAPVAGAKLSVANLILQDRLSHQAGSDGGKRNSSPGRARH
jgi:hypothetical protein